MNAARTREAAIVSCHAVHAVVTLSSDPEMCKAANKFAMITPDGQPVRWSLNLLHSTNLKERVYGPELMWRLLGKCALQGQSIFLYGSTPETLSKLQLRIKAAFPELTIAGAHSPPYRALSDAEMQDVADEINTSGASIVFIGLGCPKQDQFAAAQADRIGAVQVCVGAAFDFHAGNKPIAPKWMQRRGLEWLFRLSCEPGRLFRRYLTTNSVFVFRLVKTLLLGHGGPRP